MIIRLARPSDASAVAGIYRPFVEDSAISFEVDAPDEAVMASRIAETLTALPWLVAEEHGSVIGYAYAALHRTRAAYRWSVDVSAYVSATHLRRGIGRALYDPLLDLLRILGYANAYAGITLPNPASERLHRAVGMEPVGIYAGVGYKLGRWWDVAWYALRLNPLPSSPPEPRPITTLSADQIQSALEYRRRA